MKKMYIISFLVIFSVNNIFSQSGWFWQNPLPQGNDLNDASFINSSTGWFAGNLGTILKTTDGGISFIKFVQNVEHNYLNVKFFDNFTGYIGGRNVLPSGSISQGHFILKTTNSGQNWFVISSNNSDMYRNFVFVNKNTGWILKSIGAGNSHLYKSTNGGNTWDSININGYNVTLHFLNERFGWLGSSKRTTNGGLNWLTVPNVFEANSLFFPDSVTGFGTGTFGGIYKTTNGGENWVSVYSNGYSKFNSIYFINANTGIAAGDRRTLVRTTNGGLNWVIIETDETPPLIPGYGNNLNKVVFANGTGYIAGNFGVIKKSTSNLYGDIWETLAVHSSIWLADINFLNINTGYLSGTNPYDKKQNYVIKTTNSGSTWFKAFNNPDTNCSVSNFISENEGWIGGGRNLYKTTNGGLVWQLKMSVEVQYSLNKPFFLNSATGFVNKAFNFSHVSNSVLFKTTNGGDNWIETSLILRGFEKIKFNNFDTGWCLGSAGTSQYSFSGLRKTTNGGLNWEIVQKPNDARYIDGLDNINNDYAWCSANDSLYKTTNGGLNWIYVFSGTGLKFIQFMNINTGFVLSSDNTLFKTTNGGTTWFSGSLAQFQTSKRDFYFINENTGWIVGDFGSILKTTTGGIPLGVVQNPIQLPSSFSLHQNYPNPFNPVTNIKFQIPLSRGVSGEDGRGVFTKLIIYDLTGRVVATLVNEQLQPGSYSVDWNGAGYASGVYFYSLITNEFTETKRMVLLK